MLDLVEETLHHMPLFVPVFVVFSLLLAIFAGWNDRFRFFFRNSLQKSVRIVGAVRNRTFKFEASNQIFGLGDVMPLATRQPKTQRITQRIYAGMDFGAEPAPAASEGLCGLPTVFLEAPAAHGWARTTVLSSRMFSISGSSAKC